MCEAYICLRTLSKVILARLRKSCDYRRCAQTSKEPDVERLVKGKRAMAEFKANKLASRGKEKTARSKTEVGRRVVGKDEGGKKVRFEDEAEKDEEEVAMSGAGEEEQVGEVPPVIRNIMPVGAVAQASVGVALVNDADEMVAVEEVTVLQMEIPNFQIDQATSLQEEVYSHQTRREGEVRDREDRASLPVSTPSAEDDVMEEDSTVDVLVSAKLAKRIINQKKASHERMKQKVEFKRNLLQDLKSEDLEDEKRKTELQLMLSQIVERQQEKSAKAADLEVEIVAAEKELKKEEAKMQAALLFEEAASK